MTCELTPHGRASVGLITDRIRRGGSITSGHQVERKSPLVFWGEGNQRMAFIQTRDPDAAYLTDRECVLKISKFPDAWQNENEIINWEFSPPEVKQYLAPVREYADDAMWLVMPLVRDVGDKEAAEAVREGLSEAGYEVDDIRADQVGYYDGDPVLFDYGYRITTTSGERIGPKASEYFDSEV